jgi:tRNA A37 N6-isopentenylltransferase MiaA
MLKIKKKNNKKTNTKINLFKKLEKEIIQKQNLKVYKMMDISGDLF